MKTIFLKDIMKKPPITIRVNDPFAKTVELMGKYSIRHLPVIDSNGLLVGIISQRDVNRAASPRRAPEGKYVYDTAELDKLILANVMSTQVGTLSANHTLEDAANLMAQKKYGCIPVVDENNHVIGIVSTVDIMQTYFDNVPNKVGLANFDVIRKTLQFLKISLSQKSLKSENITEERVDKAFKDIDGVLEFLDLLTK
jgi:CBS domain-containing protein